MGERRQRDRYREGEGYQIGEGAVLSPSNLRA